MSATRAIGTQRPAAPRVRLFFCTPWTLIKEQFLRFSLVLAFVPSVSFSLTSFDTQPSAATLGIVCMAFAASSRFPMKMWFLAFPALASLVIAMISSTAAVGARSFVTYASPWIFACVAYLASQRKIEISRFIVSMIYLWAEAYSSASGRCARQWQRSARLCTTPRCERLRSWRTATVG